ncbi:Type II restriction endonuclease EcoO109I [Pseudomonas peli]|uniref:Type II restriction endonuclease EcoO109I n=1 Tax=Pseudomonas peli TaxID=592361 RepID=A0AB37ZDG2_9PSED|nr:PmeII family type II restriction endonuclease [Pseudomonas peli]NMZ71240.1 cytosolic protein [Pseudomonas peli]SCW86750.1 Type II restriction endonuclease EcoO109I [Pseudomonas peli]
MQLLNLDDVARYVEENIGGFHQKRIDSLSRLKLKAVLKRKNPYMFKAKNVQTAEQIVRGILDAHISSNEETLFGDWLEGLAIFINSRTYGGWKSGIAGVDLEFDKDGSRHIVAIKSGPNWGNSSQIGQMRTNFKTAQRTLRTSQSGLHIVAVNGCCYGRDNNPDKGDYFKLCGQRFWEFVSGDANLYVELIEPLGFKASERNEEFLVSYSQMVNKFTREFTSDFCDENGSIAWELLVQLNSASEA